MERLNVSDIQYFSVGDGDGIRTTLFLKGCNLRCPWCHNPETIYPQKQILTYPENGRIEERGRLMSPEELLPLLARDADFFRQSGGGVTVSGGEPLLQSRALAPLLRMLKNEGISIAIDTAGSLPFGHFQDVAGLTDLFLFDWKSPRAEVYKDTVGGSLELVESNLTALISMGAHVRVRIPVIPGVNDSEADARLSLEKLLRIGATSVDLLPFHRLGSGKYRALGINYHFADVEPPSKDKMRALATIFAEGFDVSLDG